MADTVKVLEVEVGLHERLKAVAKRDGWKLRGLVARLLRDGLNRYERREEATRSDDAGAVGS